ncbi:MAG TPA: hypothetical protein VF044_09670, partial [Actinomycetota bacterium]
MLRSAVGACNNASAGMVFNSLDFVAFLLVVLALWAAVPARAWRAARVLLVAASYAFYMAWSPPYGLLLLGSTVVAFAAARRLEHETRPAARRTLVAASLLVNLGVLAFFKYGRFLAENARAILGLPAL